MGWLRVGQDFKEPQSPHKLVRIKYHLSRQFQHQHRAIAATKALPTFLFLAFFSLSLTHTHTHTHIHIYIYTPLAKKINKTVLGIAVSSRCTNEKRKRKC